MSLLREIYLSLVFLVGIGAALAPFLLGTGERVFAYQTAKGGTVDMPVSVALYAALLLISLAGLVLRLVSRKSAEAGNVD